MKVLNFIMIVKCLEFKIKLANTDRFLKKTNEILEKVILAGPENADIFIFDKVDPTKIFKRFRLSADQQQSLTYDRENNFLRYDTVAPEREQLFDLLLLHMDKPHYRITANDSCLTWIEKDMVFIMKTCDSRIQEQLFEFFHLDDLSDDYSALADVYPDNQSKKNVIDILNSTLKTLESVGACLRAKDLCGQNFSEGLI